MTVKDTDNSSTDSLAAQALSDVLDFWAVTPLPGGKRFTPPTFAASWDSTTGTAAYCDQQVGANAGYCTGDESVGWDRGHLLPMFQRIGGTNAITLVMAHEVGHRVQALIGANGMPTLVREQQADCYAGSYLAWVAEGRSKRFTLSGNGLDEMLGAVLEMGDAPTHGGDHGGNLERVRALQTGFTGGTGTCAAIDQPAVEAMRAGIPDAYRHELEHITEGNLPITLPNLRRAAESVSQVLDIPTPEVRLNGCGSMVSKSPIRLCDDGTVSVDLPEVQRLAEDPQPGRSGDGSAISPLIGALIHVWARQGGIEATARVTACAVGAVARTLAKPSKTRDIELSAGDLDEIGVEVMSSGFGAVPAAGDTIPSQFERVRHYLRGVYDVDSPQDCAG
ncbi:neutral zinc metallopeptidase [Mycolicibacterium fallax]|uniref:Uncharacterized protein n=1 Tax=Mycolicibacterium fallax TaxID=1793 RepID=A0A1X1R892_MYCFA|nr:neutral zinc metallopeptidase [Mycolicibacterium fallax]ORV00961.1 hypothetical protein AWC04_14915 [Mycolicibacterium fallax]BBZ00515.1 peptidase [Mycolicibacterium fallax]